MPILVSCECGEQFREHAACAGRQARCPGCGRVLVIPTTGEKPQLVEEIAWCEPERSRSRSVVARIMARLSGRTARDETDHAAHPTRRHERVRSRISLGWLIWWVVLISVLIGLLFPTLFPAVSTSHHNARRAPCVNNLKQIGLALHNYHGVYDCFPPHAITDAAGKPLLSWRVAILPFMEQQGLYAKFKLDEPWNSPHNLALLGERPAVLACPSDPSLGTTATRYLGLVGPGAFFEGSQGTSYASFFDGTANTLAVAEALTAVTWTAPADLPFLPRGPLPALKSNHSGGGSHALFADGSVRFLKDTTPAATLRGLITRNASENNDDQSY